MVPASDKHYTARILERRDLSEDLWVIRVDPGGPFQFKAGQYATLGVNHGDKRIERAYSIVSSPCEQGLEFFIDLVPKGELTPAGIRSIQDRVESPWQSRNRSRK